MMMFRVVKNAIAEILADQAEARFQVIGYQRQSKASTEMTGNNRMVQVYYAEGDFPKNAGRMRGSKTHDITINIDMSASAPAKGNLSIIDSPTTTAVEKAIAIAAIKEAAEEADTQIDELIDAVYNIMYDARNEDLGLGVGEIASRWISSIQKDTLLERGDLVVKTANMKYTCRVQETALGDTGNLPDPAAFDSDITVGDTGGAGVK